MVEERRRIQHEIRTRVLGYVLGAFGLVAGIAWNDAVQSLITLIFKIDRQTILAKFIYAAVVTLVLVIVSVYFVRFFAEKKHEESKKQDQDEVKRWNW